MKNIKKIFTVILTAMVTITSLGLTQTVTQVKALANVSGDKILAQAMTYDLQDYYAVGTCTGLVTRVLDDLGIGDSVVGSMVGSSARYSPDEMYANAVANPQDATLVYRGTVADVAANSSLLRNGDLVIQRAQDKVPNTGFGHVGFIHKYGSTISIYGANPTTGVSDAVMTTNARGTSTIVADQEYIFVFRIGQEATPVTATVTETATATETVNISITKTDVDNGKPLSGVSFDFYRDRTVIGSAVTLANGVASYTSNVTHSSSSTKTYVSNWSELTAAQQQAQTDLGYYPSQAAAQTAARNEAQAAANNLATQSHTYQAVETVAKTAYWLNPNNMSASTTVVGSGSATLALTNKRQLATLNITKVDVESTRAQGDATLQGAVYGLYARTTIVDPADGSAIYNPGVQVATLTTDASGDASVQGLYLGEYYLQEITASEGYILDTNRYNVSITYAGQDVEITTASQTLPEQVITGDFDLEKIITSGETSEIVEKEEGAEFIVMLTKYVDQYGSIEEAYAQRASFTNKEWDYLTTDANGYAKTRALAYGTYTVKQVKGNVDTDMLETEFTFQVEYENQETKRYIINNRPFTSYLKIVKQDAETGKTIILDNATFKIWSYDDNAYVDQKVGEDHYTEFTTDENGYVVLPLELSHGEYRIDEVETPEGYLLNKNGVDFEITNIMEADRDEDGDYITVVSFTDVSVKGRVEMTKLGEAVVSTTQDEDGNYSFTYETRPYRGATFAIYARENILDPADGAILYTANTLMDEVTTGEDGIATSKELPLGAYYVIETTAPTGLVNDRTAINVDIAYGGDTVSVVVEPKTQNNERQKAELTLRKLDDKTETPLAGAVYGIYSVDDIIGYDGNVLIAKDTLIETATSDTDGYIDFTADLPLGEYYAKEIQAPIGYATNYSVYTLDATAQNQFVGTIEAYAEVKDSITKVQISKTDATTGEELEGAQLRVYEYGNEGNVFDTWVSGTDKDADGNIIPHMIKGLEVGKTYVLEETSSPYGFAIAESVTFVVADTGDVQEVEMEDEIVMGELGFLKTGEMFTHADMWQNEFGVVETPVWTKTTLLNHEITIYAAEDITLANNITYYEKDEEIEVLESDWDKVYSQKLPVGKYYYMETKVDNGYVLDTDKHYFEVEDNQSTALQIVHSELENTRAHYTLDFTKVLESFNATGTYTQAADNFYTNKEAYKDVVFGIYAREDIYNYMGEVAIEYDAMVGTTGIDENGNISIEQDLPVGVYYMKELATNDAYVISDAEYDFEITMSNDAENTVVVNEGEEVVNTLKRYTVGVTKVNDSDDSVITAGATFGIFTDENTSTTSFANYTTSNGVVTFEDLTYGTYYIKEVKAPAGYQLSSQIIKVEIDNEGVKIDGKVVEANNDDVYMTTYKNTKTPKITTGDTINVGLWFGLLGMSFLGLLAFALRKFKFNK